MREDLKDLLAQIKDWGDSNFNELDDTSLVSNWFNLFVESDSTLNLNDYLFLRGITEDLLESIKTINNARLT